MLNQRPIMPKWLLATGVFAFIFLAGAISVDLLLTSGWQIGADPASRTPTGLEGTW